MFEVYGKNYKSILLALKAKKEQNKGQFVPHIVSFLFHDPSPEVHVTRVTLSSSNLLVILKSKTASISRDNINLCLFRPIFLLHTE